VECAWIANDEDSHGLAGGVFVEKALGAGAGVPADMSDSPRPKDADLGKISPNFLPFFRLESHALIAEPRPHQALARLFPAALGPAAHGFPVAAPAVIRLHEQKTILVVIAR
jgi:hypothetical protein